MDIKPTINIQEPNNAILSDIVLDDPDDPPVISLTINPTDAQTVNSLTETVPLFIKKLWRIVNDKNNEQIVSWNNAGDGLIIHNQLEFISNTLPRYFKHNQMSSFVRQLNFYDFHKTQHIDKDEFEFRHPFFLKDVPQLLPLIKRKTQSARQKRTVAPPTSDKSTQSTEVQELMTAIKDMKSKSDVITDEMSKLKQENATLWGEINSLRVKYTKQTKIINKLIHFLIAYMQKHHNSRKSGRTVSANNSNKYLKTGPRIMEIDYRYKNNPHKFWSDFDNEQENGTLNEQEAYTVVEPIEPHVESDNTTQDPNSQNMRVSSTIEELLPGSAGFAQATSTPKQFDYATSLPSSSRATNSALQRAGSSKENVGYLIDNSRVEMNSIKELLKNLTPEDLSNFYKLVNDNYKLQEDEYTIESENELMSLAQMSPLITAPEQDDGRKAPEDPNNGIDKQGVAILNDIMQKQESAAATVQETNPPFNLNEPSLGLIGDDLLNTDDLLSNVSDE